MSSSKIKETRESALKFHGILRRYDNLVDQCKMCVKQGDDSLYDMYYKQKRLLERCDVIVTVGAKGNNIGAIATWLGADDRLVSTEYFSLEYQHRKDDDQTFKVRAAIIKALEAWGPHKLSDYKVAMVTTDDEIGKWLQQLAKKEKEKKPAGKASRTGDKNKDDKRYELDQRSKQQLDLDKYLESHDDLNEVLERDPDLKRVHDLWGEHNIQLTTFATTRHPCIDLVCSIVTEGSAEDKLQGVVASNLHDCKLRRVDPNDMKDNGKK